MKIAVIGAGIGGLSAAVGLQRAGAKVTVFERAPEVRAEGSGLSIFANGLAALETLGLREAFETVTDPSVEGFAAGQRLADGRWIVQVPNDAVGALRIVDRVDLHRILLDALAPGLILAQAFGRFGNWFNQELFGLPTTLPWGLEIDPSNPNFPAGLPVDTLFHPTFLYEVVWNSLGCLALLWLGRHLFFQWGRLFGMYLVWYGAGRIVWESIRLDPSFVVLGLRTNVWAAIGAVALGIAIIVVQRLRHPEPEESPFIPGREAVRTD